MNLDVEQHPPGLRSTGLCKTSDSSYLLHHRPPALTVQHFFNSSHNVRVYVCVCVCVFVRVCAHTQPRVVESETILSYNCTT